MRPTTFLAISVACLLPVFTVAEPKLQSSVGKPPAAAPAVASAAVPAVASATLSAPASASVIPTLAMQLAASAPGADPRVIDMALKARDCAIASGDATGAGERLAVIDYSKPSTETRMWVFDLRDSRLLYAEHVAHGQGTGDNFARKFSNNEGSHQSSLGLFRTAETYMGSNGYSMRMDGLEPGFNDRARARAIVMHGAPYVDPQAAAQRGRLGRSWGCPAVRSQVAREMIDTLKGGHFIFAYYPDQNWLRSSRLLACAAARPSQVAAN